MRITIDVDDDVLLAAKELARTRKRTLGQVISDLARKAMTREARVSKELPLFPVEADAGVVTLEIVNQLRDETRHFHKPVSSTMTEWATDEDEEAFNAL